MSAENTIKVQCPICFKAVPKALIEQHADKCADFTSPETLEILSSQEAEEDNNDNHKLNDLFNDPDIFDKDMNTNSLPPKRSSWDLENSFEKAIPSTNNPSKRKKLSSPLLNPISSKSKQKQISLAPYPDLKEIKSRGFLKNDGNNPGSAVQSLLKKPQSLYSQPSVLMKECSKNTIRKFSAQSPSRSTDFKMHPFLAKASSSKDSGEFSGAIVPDGEGGFIINDSVLDDENESDNDLCLPPLRSNGFIDFENQFKESSKASVKQKKKTQSTSRSPAKKKKWKTWGGRGKWSQGRGRRGGRGRRTG